MFRLFLMLSNSLLAWGLNAPWIHFNSLLLASFGANRCISVGQFQDSTGSIPITTCDTETAQALALILKPTYQEGRSVAISIVDSEGNTATPPTDPGSDAQALVEESLHRVLDNNHYFKKLLSGQDYIPIYVEFRRKVIQFWDDNQADFYGNSTYTAQEVFSQILQPKYFGIRVGTTTAK